MKRNDGYGNWMIWNLEGDGMKEVAKLRIVLPTPLRGENIWNETAQPQRATTCLSSSKLTQDPSVRPLVPAL